jgi:N-acetyl-gamma-glutamyl-phosphate reductase
MRKLNVLIAGSTGYIGVQLVKLLSNHQNINIKYLCGNSSVGKNISFFDKTLKNKKLPKIVKFNKAYLKNVDIIFTALPNGEAQEISKHLLANNRLIDLSADFRLEDPNEYNRWYKSKHKAIKNIPKSIYALPELCKNYLKKYKIIACPGCYPTSILLPLLPLFKKNLIFHKNIIIDSKSGYSGAGRGIHKRTTKKKLHESLSAYGVGFHRHNSEIDQELSKIKNNTSFTFTPHLSPMFRGILSTIYIDLKDNIKPITIQNVLKKFYRNKPFVKISKFNIPIGTNSVINTNKCLISVCKTKYKNKIIILSAIDNLIKGGAGQAVQNMNIFFNFLETKGLK